MELSAPTRAPGVELCRRSSTQRLFSSLKLSPLSDGQSKGLVRCGEWVLFGFLVGEPARSSPQPTLPKPNRTCSPRPSKPLKLNPLPDGQSKGLVRFGEWVLFGFLAGENGRSSSKPTLPKPNRTRSPSLSSPLETTLPPKAIPKGCSAVGSEFCHIFWQSRS